VQTQEPDYLEKFVACAVKKLTAPQRKQLTENLKNGMTLSSACSGSGMAEAVHLVLARQAGATGHVGFACECKTAKADWIHNVAAEGGSVHTSGIRIIQQSSTAFEDPGSFAFFTPRLSVSPVMRRKVVSQGV
jgi:hypothetical protein